MSTTIQIKRSSTASAIPVTGDIAVGELAVNLADKRLYTKQSDGTIIELSTNPTDLDAATLRIDGVEITASATELNSLDGFTGSTTELNILDGLTATTIELNTLDGITASTAELNKLDGYTGSTAELNILDGVTATTAELNYVDGVTSNIQTQLNNKQPLDAQLTDVAGLTPADGSFIVGNGTNFVAESGDTAIASLGVTATAAELNTLDGITSTTAELNILDGVTATATEINALDGITATTAELNITDGLTATTAELNTLDGITASTLELNYTDGVTSNIQTQLNGKATTAQGVLADSAVQPDDDVSFGTGSFSGAVDVTGTVTADGLTVDGDAVVNGGASGTDTDVFIIKNDAGTAFLRVQASDLSSSACDWTLRSGASESIIFSPASSKAMELSSNGDVSFYEDTGTTAKMVWDASEEQLNLNGSVSGKVPFRTFSGGYTAEYNSYSAEEGFQVMSYQSDGGSPYTKTADLIANSDGTAPSEMRLLTKANGASNPTERMRIDSAGNVGIGTASPNKPLTVKGEIRSEYLLSDAQSYWGTASDKVYFGTAEAYPIVFETTGTERARLDSSGNLLVGTTSQDIFNSTTQTGVVLNRTLYAALQATNNGQNAAIFNRTSSDGSIVQFRKDGLTVGSIGTASSGDLYIADGRNAGVRFDGGNNQIAPCTSSGSNLDATLDLGLLGARFKDLYLSGGVITSSDYRLKEDIQPMQSYADTVKQMNLVNFAWKESGKREDGFIAHELQALVPNAVRGDKDAINEDGEAQHQGVDPLKLIPVLAKALQEALERIETLENK